MEHKFAGLQAVIDSEDLLGKQIFKLKILLDQWNQNLVTRKQLRELDDDQLKDIGVDRISAEHESRKPFWKN